MARKFNWQKVTSQKRIQNEIYRSKLDKKYASIDRKFRWNNIWQIGKHKGKLIKNLTTNYLIWASKNLKDPIKGIADKELIARYQNIQHKRSAGQTEYRSEKVGNTTHL